MKIKEEIRRILNYQITISRLNIEQEEKFDNSPFNENNFIPLKLNKFKIIKCHFCESDCFNYCWNCEKPHCKKHSYGVLCPGNCINTFCVECAKDFIKEMAKYIRDAEE